MTGKHLTQETIAALWQGSLDPAEEMEALGHIAGCETCAEAFAGWAEEEMELLPLPAGLEEQVAARVGRLRRERQANAGREFWGFTLRVGLSAAAAIALLFTANLPAWPAATNQLPAAVNEPLQKGTEFFDRVADRIAGLSLTLFDLGVLGYDKETK